MSRFSLLIAATAVALLMSVTAIAAESSLDASLKCDIGPLAKTYGKNPWFVYSCNDGRTVTMVSAPGNPATPFTFTITPGSRGLQVSGHGAGSKEVTNAVYSDIASLSERDVRDLVEQTKRVTR